MTQTTINRCPMQIMYVLFREHIWLYKQDHACTYAYTRSCATLHIHIRECRMNWVLISSGYAKEQETSLQWKGRRPAFQQTRLTI
jgi:hypothetical protein